MTLSNSRQQFLAYESQQAEENIGYERRGGMFVTTCVCISFIVLAVIVAVLVGVIVYFITYFKISQSSGEFWDETEPFGHTGPPSVDLRLPSQVVPSFYRLKLKTDLDNASFTGEVYITIRATTQVKTLILHAKDLTIDEDARLTEQVYEKVDVLHSKKKREAPSEIANTTETNNTFVEPTTNTTEDVKPEVIILSESNNATEGLNITEISSINSDGTVVIETETPKPPQDTQVTHSSVKDVKIVSITQESGERLMLTLATPLRTGVDYTLELSFKGNITNSLTGFYKSTYTNDKKEVKHLGVTQFEPTSARAAFPCFDEPEFKAKFEISIAHPRNLSVLSNMKVAAQEDMPENPDWQWTHFERSVNMSTYLVAYVLSDFKSLETNYTSKDNVTKTIRVWARPELINKAQYALSITPKLLEYYEEVFGIPYALDKMDLVAIPDFSSGAMENWGLITFRETTLLFDEATSIPRDKQNVAIDVAHELAHQWFGNLVTMRWWTDLWLNEGFATYIEYVGVDKIQPEWKMFESFTQDKMDLLRTDALKNTSPVSRKVIDASEISQKFDEISYTKGANLIRMLNHTISGELFHKGLLIYLKEWMYTNAEENDLWLAMTAATKSDPTLQDLSVVKFMNSWTRQAGYPVVNVERDYHTGEITFEQRLFTTSKSPYQSMADQLWQIPISFGTLSSDTAPTEPKLWLTERTARLTANVTSGDALYVNVEAIGYYRVNYDIKNWELLREALKNGKVKSPIAKAQLIDDAFNLAKVSQLNYSYALDLTTFVIDGESSKMVWDLLLNNMAFLKHCLKVTPGYGYFMDYIKTLITKQLEVLNYGLDKPKDDNEAFLIENLLMWECYVESPRCLSWAKKQFDDWANQDDLENNPIPSYLRSLVYNMALKHGGRREFELLWKLFQNTTDPNVKNLIISNLPSTKEESLITLLLERSLTEIPKQYAVAVWSVDSTVGSTIARNFLIDNWERVFTNFEHLDSFMFPGVFSGAFGGITTQSELDKFKAFAIKHKERLKPISQTLQKLVDTATLRIEWIAKYAHNIQVWLKQFVTGKLESTTTGSQTSTVPPSSTETSTSTANVTSAPAEVSTVSPEVIPSTVASNSTNS